VGRLLVLCALLLGCRPQPAVTARPQAERPPDPPPDPCAERPVPPDTNDALVRADELLRCGDEARAVAVHLELLRRDPASTVRAYQLAELAHAAGRGPAIAGDVAGLPLGPAARAVHDLTRDVLAYLERPDPERGGTLVRDVAAALALTNDDAHVLGLALRFTAVRDPDPNERAAPLCRDRAEPLFERPRPPPGGAVLAASCARIAFMAGEPGVGRRRYARALALDPRLHAAALAWAAAELAAGNFSAAAALYRHATAAPSARLRYPAFLGLGVAQARRRDRAAAEAAYREAAAVLGVRDRPVSPDRLPIELMYNLGTLLADSPDPAARAESRALLTAFAARPEADPKRRLRARHLLHELGG
jgi:tetratricopeptide (TPR) repeat protein